MQHLSLEENPEYKTTLAAADNHTEPVSKIPAMNDPTGAALVVGGGIAGMQASLDLAQTGIKVYMVEKESAIGGNMARLDKTFPSNDCAMCTISPRLLDTGQHLDIEVLTNTELAGLDGTAGDFTARLDTQPRFIDPDACTSCGNCAEVCPVEVGNEFEGLLSKRHAAYKLYPQGTPNAFAIEKRGVAPCREACPTGQRAQGYIALIAAGRFEEAYRTIKRDNPFPAICGRICNARCELACSRGMVDEPVSIRALKRFVTDRMLVDKPPAPQKAERLHKEKIAVIGAGPAGLTAAQDLCLEGYGVTVFEALPVAGGMLRVGVPAFRLPTEIIQQEVDDIVALGVDLRLSSPVENLDDLFTQGYSAVLISVGAHEGNRLPIPGSDLDGILVNTVFLRDVRLHQAGLGKYDPKQDIEGKRVAVIGGGDVAMDVARTAQRLGASEVHVAMRESVDNIPAGSEEVKHAAREGIELHTSLHFSAIRDNGKGQVAGIECQRVSRFDIQPDGRWVPEIIENSDFLIDADVVVFSAGQKAGLSFVPKAGGIRLTARQTLETDPQTLATDRPGVFAAGDAVSGTAFVIEAIASGHKAAKSIECYLRGETLQTEEAKQPVAGFTPEQLQSKVLKGELTPTPRVLPSTLPAGERADEFQEVEPGYNEQQARAEASRCLSCGICSECGSCEEACGVQAINLDDTARAREVNVGAVIMAPGYQLHDASGSEELGLGRYPNVLSSLQYERLMSASGPTTGKVLRPSDQQAPKRVAWLQCVGSRDACHDYCSSVCCMYATKQATMTKGHWPDTDIEIFVMDVRSFSKGYENYYRKAREELGIRYTRCRVSRIVEDPATNNLVVRFMERGTRPGGGTQERIREEVFDMVVLSSGMEISEETRKLAGRLNVEIDNNGFCKTVQHNPLQTSRDGVFAVGPFREPKDIPESLLEASGAAAQVGALLKKARGSLTTDACFPPEREIAGENPKVAVFVCHCGSNIGGYLDVPDVAEYAQDLPGVVHAEHTLYACSQDSVAQMTEKVKESGANRVVVASCTPLTHEPVFRKSLQSAGLNPYLLDMANIRNQCSWVHGHDWDAATSKARELVRMSVARAGELDPLTSSEQPVQHGALVIGGGAAGMEAALSLAEQGFPVDLVERGKELGGVLNQLHFGLDEFDDKSTLPPDASGKFVSPADYLAGLTGHVRDHASITVHTNAEVVSMEGHMGDFTTRIGYTGGPGQMEVRHGAAVVCTGGVEYRGDEYAYGTDDRITTQQQFEGMLGEHVQGKETELPDRVVMIQCVGPADRYCGRICCTSALKNALKLKQLKPGAEITVLFKDIRTYGFKERLYTQAREAGILFMRYEDDFQPEVTVTAEGELQVSAWEEILGRQMDLKPDLLVLSTPVVPSPGAEDLAKRLKVAQDRDGFFLEAHVKLRPVDFLADGIFMAGLAHYPKLLSESITQARAAASRAATILSRDTLTVGGAVAVVEQDKCVGCLTCVRVCAFGAARIDQTAESVGGIIGAAQIEPSLCQGCGLCTASCPAGAIQLKHYTGGQMEAKLEALFNGEHG